VSASGESAGLSLSTLLLLLVWPVLVAGGAAWWTLSRLDQALADRPPVVYVDELAAVRREPDAGSPEATARAGVARSQQAAQRLADAGFLVLTRRAVYAAPPDLEVQP
jgi:hypothetical protein